MQSARRMASLNFWVIWEFSTLASDFADMSFSPNDRAAIPQSGDGLLPTSIPFVKQKMSQT